MTDNAPTRPQAPATWIEKVAQRAAIPPETVVRVARAMRDEYLDGAVRHGRRVDWFRNLSDVIYEYAHAALTRREKAARCAPPGTGVAAYLSDVVREVERALNPMRKGERP